MLQRFLGARMQIKVEFTDTIPMVRTGKRLVAVSKLKIDLQEGGSTVTGSAAADVGAEPGS